MKPCGQGGEFQQPRQWHQNLKAMGLGIPAQKWIVPFTDREALFTVFFPHLWGRGRNYVWGTITARHPVEAPPLSGQGREKAPSRTTESTDILCPSFKLLKYLSQLCECICLF